MGSKDLKAKIRLEGDAKGAIKAVKKTESGFKRLTKTIKTSALAQVAAFAGVALALRALVRGIGSAITAANKQEDAINALEGALAPLGDQVDRVSKSLQEQASALQKITTFGDETIIEAQAMIASFVREEDAIKAATVATIDLAEAKGFDLVAAADLVSKTLGSSTNALTRYGIEVTGAVGSSERLASMTENIARVFGGRATKATETFSGKVGQLSNVFGDMQEAMGFAITESDEAGTSIDRLKDTIVEITPKVAEFSKHIVLIGTGAINSAGQIAQFISSLVWLGDTTGALVATEETRAAALKEVETRTRLLGNVSGWYNGILEKLGVSIKHLNDQYEEQDRAMLKAIGFLESYGSAQEKAAARTALIEAKLNDEATALSKLAAALGEVTQIELEKEYRDIADALDEARESTDANSDAFVRYEQIATEKMARIQTNINRVKDGLEVLVDTTDDAGDAIEEFGDKTDDAGDQVDDLGEAIDGASESADTLRDGMASATRGMQLAGVQAVRTAREFDALADSAGRAAAVSAALAGGGTLSQGGSRIRLPGGGSRLVNVSGIGDNRSSYALSQFGTGGRATLDDDGNLRPA
jgi:uncharacterized coiled-coil DUF342 family protein